MSTIKKVIAEMHFANMMDCMKDIKKLNPAPLCKCGCGNPVTQKRDGSFNEFLNHHYIRINNPAQTEKFKERMSGEQNPAKRKSVREKISKSLQGVYVGDKNHMKQEKYRKLFSEKMKGEKNPMFGKTGSLHPCYGKISPLKGSTIPEERKERISRSNKKKVKTPEHIKKISKTLKEKGISKGEDNPFYGKRHTLESRKKISKKRKSKHGMDKTHPLWDEIITPLRYRIRQLTQYKEWRKTIFERDKYTCQQCLTKGDSVFLNVHHVHKSFSTIIMENQISSIEDAISCNDLWDIHNGITLCRDCHYKLHRKKQN
jgi:5-methylcytosine-specific restriction endonuclease McrA